MSSQISDPDLQVRHDELIGRLAQLEDDPGLDGGQRELAQAWRRRLESVRERALAPLSIAFMAKVGCGKSTLIAAATGLRLEQVGGSPKKWSVLPVDDGRTTLGDTRITFSEREDILLEIEPVPVASLKVELRLFAEDLWAARRESGKRGSGGQAGEELYGLLRSWLAPDSDDPRAVLAELAGAAADAEELGEVLLSRLDLDQRTRPFTRCYSADEAGRCSLKQELRAVMRGRLAEAPAPQRLRLQLPMSELGRAVDTIIDTQGIDSAAPEASIRGRTDLQGHLLDEDTLFVACSEFASAPDVVSRKLIETFTSEERLRARAWRLLIVDKRELDDEPEERARQDRLRRDRVAECREQLHREGLTVPDDHVLALDARSEVEELRRFLTAFADVERERRGETWAQTYAEASEAIELFADVEFAAQARTWDLRLRWVWDAELSRRMEARKEDLSRDGLLAVAVGVRLMVPTKFHWSQLRAAIRRRGQYGKLSLAVFGADVATLAIFRIATAVHVSLFAEEVAKSVVPRLADHLRLRVSQYLDAIDSYRTRAYPMWTQALQQYFSSPKSDELWAWCEARWGQGPGYVEAVSDRFGLESERVKLVKLVPAQLPDPQTFEDQLPPRPPLFRLRRIELQNFRCVEHRAIPIAENITTLVGENGVGKTCWLEAIAAAVGVMLPDMGAPELAPPLTEFDVRQVTQVINDIPDSQPQLPMRLELDATLQGRELTWGRKLESLAEGDVLHGVGMRAIAKEAAEEVRAHVERQLPVLAYYGTQRLWPADLEASKQRREIGNRLEGYRDCLQAASNHRRMLEWFRHYTLAGLQRNKPFEQLRAIERAVVQCVEGAARFEYNLPRENFILYMESGEPLLFRQLSDGYRNIVAMVADIAWRASRLNPQLGARAAELAEGIVLIDEIDLHLHPKWQRHVLADLQRAFPRLQFVTTTHSPFIIQSLRPGQLVNLAADAQPYDYADASPEDITEHVMGVPLPQRSARRTKEAEVATRYYELLDKLPDADPLELAALERELDELAAPHADNQAFVALLQRERLVAQAQRSP